MENIYENFNDVRVRLRKIYVKASDKYAYADEKCTVTIEPAELLDVFHKGVVIVDADGNEYVPVKGVLASDVTTLTYLTVSDSTVTAATVESKAKE